MRLKRFTLYILEHRTQTLLLTFLLTLLLIVGGASNELFKLLSPLASLGIVVAALITLVSGPSEGAMFTLAATAPYFAVILFPDNPKVTGVPIVIWAAVGVAVFSNILTWVFAVMLCRKASWSTLLQVGALVAVLAISILHLLYPEIASWWGEQLMFYYKQAQTMAGMVTTTPSDLQIQAINSAKQFATGLMTTGILVNAILQLVVARWWQAIVFKPGLLRKELHNIRLSTLAGVLFLVSVIFSYLGNSVVLDIMPVLYTLFGIAGLSVIHYLFGLMNSGTAWFWLAVVYLMIFFSFPMSIVIVALVGLLDVWIDIRHRIKKLSK